MPGGFQTGQTLATGVDLSTLNLLDTEVRFLADMKNNEVIDVNR